MASTITPLYTAQTAAQPFDNDLAGDISYADTNNYLSQLYSKEVLFKFYASTVMKEITNR